MKKKQDLPTDFCLTPDLIQWAKLHNYSRLSERMDWFIDYCLSSDKQYADYKAAFRNSVRGDWAKLNTKPKDYTQNIVERGKEVGLEARPGESLEQFTQRVMSARH